MKFGTSGTQVGRVVGPVPLQAPDQRGVREPDHGLQQLELLCQTDGPASCQPHVVVILRREAGEPAKAALRIEHLEQIGQAHLPGPALRVDHGFESLRSGAVAAAGVEIDQLDIFHVLDALPSQPQPACRFRSWGGR